MAHIATTTPLIIEPHPADYTGLPFLTLIEYRKQHLLTIIDNVLEDAVRAYVLDLCQPEQVNENLFLTVATDWYSNRSSYLPFSIYLSRTPALMLQSSKILRSLNPEFITRIIGPAFYFNMCEATNIKRRRRRVSTTKQSPVNTVISFPTAF